MHPLVIHPPLVPDSGALYAHRYLPLRELALDYSISYYAPCDPENPMLGYHVYAIMDWIMAYRDADGLFVKMI